MRSSISNSERLSLWLLLACTAGAFVAMCALGAHLPSDLKANAGMWQAIEQLGDSWRLTYRDGHYAFYWNQGGFMDSARQADVLILGNSRTSFAFRQEFLRPFGERTGLRFFDLTFYFTEPCLFPLKIIQKYDLKPKLAIINADYFFVTKPSGLCEIVLAGDRVPEGEAEGPWAYLKYFTEDRLADRLRRLVHPWLPRWEGIVPSGPPPRRLWRSVDDGSWLLAGLDFHDSHIAVPPREAQPPYELTTEERQAIAQFQAEMVRRGTAIVLTLVPYPRAAWTRAESVAEALGAPLLTPFPEGLSTLDGSHFDRESATRFTSAFLEELTELPVMAQIERGPEGTGAGPPIE